MTSSAAATIPRISLAASVRREGLVVLLSSIYAVFVLMALPWELVQDSWLTLVSGREVVHHGLPSHDQLTVWTQGARWVDQQWLAQIAFYGLAVVGGIKLVLLAHAALIVAAFTLALVAARRLGASPGSTSLVGVLAIAVAPWSLQMRAQSVAMLLFVAVLSLLVCDSRWPSRRVLLVLPLLALWANVHGTVVLGALLVALRGLTRLAESLRRAEARASERAVAALLVVGAPLCIFASPYGLALSGYYHRLLANPLLPRFINEWGPSTPSFATAPFYLLAFASIWLIGRNAGRLTRFEKIALLVTLASALEAIRSIIWFDVTALVLVPAALDGLKLRGPLRFATRLAGLRAAAAGLAPVAALGAVVVFGYVASRPAQWYLTDWPEDGAAAVGAAASRAPSVQVFAADRYADWLLWEAPQLRGRIAYDVRFELFTRKQFQRLRAYKAQAGSDWRLAAKPYDLLVIDSSEGVAKGATSEPARTLYRGPGLLVTTNKS